MIYSTTGGREFTLDLQSCIQKQFQLFGLSTQTLDAAQCAAILSEIGPLFESGALKPPSIGQEYPLSDVASAYARVASGGGGKIVFVMSANAKEMDESAAAVHTG